VWCAEGDKRVDALSEHLNGVTGDESAEGVRDDTHRPPWVASFDVLHKAFGVCGNAARREIGKMKLARADSLRGDALGHGSKHAGRGKIPMHEHHEVFGFTVHTKRPTRAWDEPALASHRDEFLQRVAPTPEWWIRHETDT
jgi:hypothetical protein